VNVVKTIVFFLLASKQRQQKARVEGIGKTPTLLYLCASAWRRGASVSAALRGTAAAAWWPCVSAAAAWWYVAVLRRLGSVYMCAA